jgi:transcriptional regulator with PAS, ATPase and Fis domain
MTDKIICEYCNTLIYKKHKTRHLNSKLCKEKQNNNINIIEYNCKYCNKIFNRKDDKNKHELNMSCNAKDILHKLELKEQELTSYKENKEKELENKEYIIQKFQEETKEQKETITDLRNQLYVLQQYSLQPKNTTNIININNLNVNFSEIQNHLPDYNINILSNKMNIIKFILDIFIHKLIVVDEKKKILGYFQDNKSINDIKCKNFFKQCAHQLLEPNKKLCDNYNRLLDKELINQAYSNKEMMFDMIDKIDLFVRREEGKVYIEYIINEVNKK